MAMISADGRQLSSDHQPAAAGMNGCGVPDAAYLASRSRMPAQVCAV
jgi:hypothetical protein